jgi:hypothetical protein
LASVSSEGLAKYVHVLTKLKTDAADLKIGFSQPLTNFDELAVLIDNAG